MNEYILKLDEEEMLTLVCKLTDDGIKSYWGRFTEKIIEDQFRPQWIKYHPEDEERVKELEQLVELRKRKETKRKNLIEEDLE